MATSRAALYARVSTEKQEKQDTIDSQLASIREYAAVKNIIIIEEYVDNGYSGATLNRPSLDKLRDDCKQGKLDTVLVFSRDRLSRTQYHMPMLRNEFAQYKVNILYTNSTNHDATPEGEFLSGIEEMVAQYEKAKIHERTRRGKLHKVKNNMLVASIPPYGYRYQPIDKANNKPGQYIVRDDEANVVKLIFTLLVEKGMSIRGIAKELTNRGISPRQGIKWSTSSLHRILRNQTYTSITHYNKHELVTPTITSIKYRRSEKTGRKLRPKDQWIPIQLPEETRIISNELFDAAQKQLKQNSNLSPRNVKNIYLLRGLLECSVCGSPLHGTPCHGKLYYRCGNKHRTFPYPKVCDSGMVRANNIEETIWSTVKKLLLNPDTIMKQLNVHLTKVHTAQIDTEKEISLLDQKVEKLKLDEGRIIDLFRDNIIDKNQLEKQLKKLKETRLTIESEKAELAMKFGAAKDIQSMEDVASNYITEIAEKLKYASRNPKLKSDILHLALDKVVVSNTQLKIRGILPISHGSPCNIASTLH